MKTLITVTVAGAACLATSSYAGFAGFVAFSRNVGGNTVIDVFAATTNSSDKFLNAFDTSSNGVFVQKAGLATKTWKPDFSGFTSTRSTSDDSFMTAGTFSGGAYGGEYYASANTNGDPNFTGTSWNATPASAAATTIPALAGWYTGDPTSVDNRAELLSAAVPGATRTDSVLVQAYSGSPPASSASALHGIWCAHLVVSGNDRQIGADFTFAAGVSIKDGANGITSQARYRFDVPAPGAVAVLVAAGLLPGRRRSSR